MSWTQWNLGGKLMIISACVALLSSLLPWYRWEWGHFTGTDYGYAFLLPRLAVFIYPVWCILSNQKMHFVAGFAFYAIGLLLSFEFMVEWGSGGNAGLGWLCYFLGVLGMGGGIGVLYEQEKRSKANVPSGN